MSALLQTRPAPFTMGSLLAQIGLIANTAKNELSGFRDMIALALSAPGVRRITVDARLITLVAQSPVARGLNRRFSNTQSIWASIEANGRSWGRVNVATDEYSELSWQPEGLVSFLGQQLALLLNRLDLVRERENRVAQKDRLAKRLKARKDVNRAGGLVASERGISQHQALQDLVRQARTSRETLSQLAETVVLRHKAKQRRLPVQRRFQTNTRINGER